jgi:autotransporter-associated beta strand protein
MKTQHSNPFRTGLAAAATLTFTFTLLAAGPLWAANIWDGGGFVDDWTAANNWDDNVVPVANATLTFAGNTRNTPVNTTSANRQYNGLLFTNDGSAGNTNAFILAGNAITLGGNITTTANTAGSTITDEISMDMILNGTRTITTNHQNSSVQHNLIISGNISETGGARGLTKAGSGQLTLTGSNSFSGTLGIFGTLNANSIADSTVNSALGKGNTIRIGTSGGTGTLNMTAGATDTNRQIQIGNGTDPAHFGGARINNNTTNGAGTLVFTNANFNALNATAIIGRTLTLGGANTDANEIQGIIRDNSASGTIGVTKVDAGTWVLSGSNSSPGGYTGATSVNGGRLSISSTGTINNTSGVSIGAGEFNYNNSTTALTQGITFSGSTGTLSGTGTITPAVTITSGNRQTAGTSVTTGNPTATLGKQTFSGGITYNTGSIFEWNLTGDTDTTIGTRGINYDAVNTASLGATTGAIFRVVLNGAQDFSESFWDSNRTWSDIFKTGDAGSDLSIASIFSAPVQYYNSAGVLTTPTAQGSFTISGTSLAWTAIPEPTSALAGLLLTAGLLRRRRNVGC